MAGWKRLASATADGSSSTLSVSFTANDVIRLQVYGQNTSGAGNFQIRFNNDTTANRHKTRRVYDGAGTSSNRYDDYSSTKFISYSPTSALQSYMIIDVHNIDNEEHLVMGNSVESGATGAGSTGVPHTVNWMGKYTEKTPQVTSVQLITNSNNLNDKSYINVLTTSSNVVTDEKDSLTNVPENTRYEEVDTRKIYRAGSLDPVFYYKFDEASGNVINHGSVADADLTVSGLTRDVSTPSGIGNGMSAPSNNSADYAQNTSRVNDYKFMHDGTTKWSVSFWLNLTSFAGSSSWTETYFFGNVWTDDNGIGWVIRTAYQSASVGKLQVFIANNTSSMPLNHSQSDMIPELNAWHHYTVTYDPSASSNQLTMTRDAATSGTGFAQSSTDNANWSTANPTRKVTFFARTTSSYDGGMAGKLAQVIIWKGHILTADEKTALYASGNGTTTLPSPLEWKERNTA